MFASTLTLGTRNFDLNTQRTYSSVRKDPTTTVAEPTTLTISHDVSKTGRVSSAVILDDLAVIPVGSNVISDNVRVMLKIQYSPSAGRSDIEATVTQLTTDLKNFLSTAANITKVLNRES